MAVIIITGAHCMVQLSLPDEDGDYSWKAGCGDTADAYRPIDEAIAHAEMHVDQRSSGSHGDSPIARMKAGEL